MEPKSILGRVDTLPVTGIPGGIDENAPAMCVRADIK